MCRVTPEERRAIDEAIERGRVSVVKPAVPLRLRERSASAESDKEPASKTPAPYRLPETMSVLAALEWAFRTEKASFEFDEIGGSAGGQRPGRGTEAVLIERGMIGATIDTSRGRSEPADDAQVIASIVRNVLPWGTACFVADLARAGREPDWMEDASPRLVPVEWVYGRGVCRGRTGDASRLGSEGWPHWFRRNKNGVRVEEVVLFTPCTWTPTAKQIAGARRIYLDWWGALLEVRAALAHVDLKFRVTDEMPAMCPWRTGIDR